MFHFVKDLPELIRKLTEKIEGFIFGKGRAHPHAVPVPIRKNRSRR